MSACYYSSGSVFRHYARIIIQYYCSLCCWWCCHYAGDWRCNGLCDLLLPCQMCTKTTEWQVLHTDDLTKNMRFDIQFNVHLIEFVIIVQADIMIQYHNQVRFIAVIQKITAWFGLSVWRFIRNPHCVKNIYFNVCVTLLSGELCWSLAP